MQRTPSFEPLDEEFILEELYGQADFDLSLDEFHSEAKELLQSFVKKSVIKSALKKQYEKLTQLRDAASTQFVNKKDSVKRTLMRGKTMSSENLRAKLNAKKKQLEKKIHTEPFLRISDKIAFTVGIIFLCVSEYLILKSPATMPFWYTCWLFPLLIARYFNYSKAKFTYFMLDFCYFSQLLLLASLYIFPANPSVFQLAFSVSNGPLAVGIVMWRNSLVFHDLDKLTSVFIHIVPALVTFCVRWYPPAGTFETVCTTSDCSISLWDAFVVPMICYTVWQLLYLVQTEIIDKEKIQKDCSIMTSARWMSVVRPHPIWVWFQKRGAKPSSAMFYLVATQFLYTILTLIPIPFIYESFELHVFYLSFMFIVCLWNGANFYFEIFTQTYTKRLQRFIQHTIEENAKVASEANPVESVSS